MLITSIALAANHGQIFRDLDKHLKSKISKHTQYGMLYICGKNVQYLPSEDREKLKEVEASNKGKKILMYPIKRMDDVFSNYTTAISEIKERWPRKSHWRNINKSRCSKYGKLDGQ